MTNIESRIKELASVIKTLEEALGCDLSGNSFDSRFRIQKSIYFLNSLGDESVPNYNFNNYVRGPYSPQLAEDYYKLKELDINPSPLNLSDRSIDVLKKIFEKGFIFAEATATLHSTWRYNESLGKDRIINHVLRRKPYIGRDRLKEAWKYLEDTGIIYVT